MDRNKNLSVNKATLLSVCLEITHTHTPFSFFSFFFSVNVADSLRGGCEPERTQEVLSQMSGLAVQRLCTNLRKGLTPLPTELLNTNCSK